ncbi:hypothetical protein HWV62_30342 [Athelia sp. TMB]|nr:hypothetical protein HWV62_30342 [Athelia sp. TMB]
MSSDGYFEGDDFDPSLLNEIDAIEAFHTQPTHMTIAQPVTTRAPPLAREDTSDFFDDSFAIDDVELQRIDNFIEDAYNGKAAPVASPSTVSRTGSKATVQTTLFGDVLQQNASSSKVASTRTIARQPSFKRSQFGQQAPKTKTWDRTEFAKSGWKKKAKGKGKAKGNRDDDEDEDEDEDEEGDFEQFPAPFVSLGPPPAMKLEPDLLAAKHWIYPLNKPKRDYQFNIVKHSLFENTLVALPTGLGKTFIAGVVMLNYYKWFPEGKVIFVAPTKPLVAQQIEASHKACGIPGQDAAELTGEIQRSRRMKLWEEKRVFYMTPQTLVNDLQSGACDPMDIVLIIVGPCIHTYRNILVTDITHAQTKHTERQVIRFLMATNPHFRVLALSATPGGDPEKVQNIVNNLHISRIEIRDEQSMDIRQYIFKKEIKQHIIAMNDDVNKIKDLLAKIMEATLKPLVARGIIEPLDVVKMHPYRAQMKMKELAGRKQQQGFYAPLSKLQFLARTMGYLFEASVRMCHEAVKAIASGTGEEANKSASAKAMGKQLRGDVTFTALLKELDEQQTRPGGYGPHPKMDALKMLMLEHFVTTDDSGDRPRAEDTRAMIFVTNRGCVEEVVQWLNEEKPMLKAVPFIGQSTDKQGGKGYTQKKQQEVINQFKAGVYNVMVCTSIGEEGLDIGDVDLIVCYDAQKAPIRMLQRIGRTGRKRTGYVHVLLSEIREEANWDKAKDTYGEVQKSIVRGDQLELYGDVERLLPVHMKPQCIEKVMEIQEYVRDDKEKEGKKSGPSAGATAAAKKRKRDLEDMGKSIPDGAFAGFVKASDLKASAKKKKKKNKEPEFDLLAGEDDEIDLEIEAGPFGPRRTASTSAAGAKTKSKAAGNLRKTKTMDVKGTEPQAESKKKKKPSKAKKTKLTSSQFEQMGVDDSDDMDIERGVTGLLRRSAEPVELSSPPPRSRHYKSPKILSPSPERWHNDSVIDITDSEVPDAAPAFRKASPLTRPTSPKYWTSSPEVRAAEDDVISINSSPGLLPYALSPESPLKVPTVYSSGGRERNKKGAHSSGTSASPPRACEEDSMAWLLDGDEEPIFELVKSSPVHSRGSPSPSNAVLGSSNIAPRQASLKQQLKSQADESVEIVSPRSLPQTGQSSKRVDKGKGRSVDMPPPDLPGRISMPYPTPVSDHGYPEATFAIRPAGRRSKQRAVVAEPESPSLSALPKRRLRRKRSETSPDSHPPAPKSKRIRPPPQVGHWIVAEAVHSGDEVSEGSSGEEEEETEFDREFLKEAATQASPSYNQTLAYRQSLLSQAPNAPFFSNRPVARGALFAGGRKDRPLVSSSPPREDEEPDEYDIGSFVVDDDAEIAYASSDI